MTDTIKPADPLTIIAGIRQFGLAADGSDLRDLEAAIGRISARATLTKAQKDLLSAAVRDGRVGCVASYPPSKRLIELGLAAPEDGGAYGFHYLEPTEAGRAVIAALSGGQ
jgi:hypothetical protein